MGELSKKLGADMSSYVKGTIISKTAVNSNLGAGTTTLALGISNVKNYVVVGVTENGGDYIFTAFVIKGTVMSVLATSYISSIYLDGTNLKVVCSTDYGTIRAYAICVS